MADSKDSKWWKEAVGYQIWPASFKDSNGDGLGDIKGIVSKLDHISSLGVDFIWLSPVYDSPQADMGYDVRDYENIWRGYGTLDDMDLLIAEAKKRNMRIVMDLVINHTSNEHKWFLESKKSRSNPYSDWYLWRDPRYDQNGKRKPPSNWRAAFGGSTWEYVADRDQYYLHLALPQQPDLNWTNPVTRQAVFESAVDFWLRRGIDGFRIDVVNFYWKDPNFPDADVVLVNEEFQPMQPQHIINGAEVHVWLKELRSKMTQKHGDDVVLIGELPGTDVPEVLKYVSASSEELDMVFDFDIFMAGNAWTGALHDFQPAPLPVVKDAVLKTQDLLEKVGDAWTTAFLENHDNSRSISRFGPGEGPYWESAAKMLALFVATLSGTMFVYQGQEIGMTNIPNHWCREDFRDKAIFRYLNELAEKHPGDEMLQQRGLEAARRFGRDNARTPVQWSGETFGGFSTSKPWIRVNDNYTSINESSQRENDQSILNFWKKIIQVRKEYRQTMIYGKFSLLDRDNERTFSYTKTCRDLSKQMLVVLNFSESPTEVTTIEAGQQEDFQLIMSTSDQTDSATSSLKPWEGRLYRIPMNV